MGKLLHVVLPQPVWIGLLWQQFLIELHIGREAPSVELRRQRVCQYCDASLPHQRHALELRYRVRHSLVCRQNGIDRRELGIALVPVGDARHQYVGLPLHIDDLLLLDCDKSVRMNFSRVAAVDGDDVFLRVGVIIDRFDGEDAPPLRFQRLLDEHTLLPNQLFERRILGIIHRLPACDGPGPVMVPNALERAQPDCS